MFGQNLVRALLPLMLWYVISSSAGVTLNFSLSAGSVNSEASRDRSSRAPDEDRFS